MICDQPSAGLKQIELTLSSAELILIVFMKIELDLLTQINVNISPSPVLHDTHAWF